MRIEGEKGVKTQSAPNIGRGRAKVILAEQFPTGPTVTVEPGRNPARPDYLSRDRNVRAARTNRKERPRSAEFCIGTDRPYGRSGKNARPRPKSLAIRFGRPNRSTATKSIGHRPKLFSAKVSPLFINSNRF
ncbi:unnamed protein product [Microthlaspi erraticum]|uniref:Uncharacterized protein n=1 Tax=Microthlaspi erraticum TaxID=1685480 RepID=A0A6D2JPN7_9BRAS|nr:unnamed protein product [Microthlaspi erraticum]